jgi:hypothetical protein
MSQDDSSRILNQWEEVWRIFTENREDEAKLDAALLAYIREKAKDPLPKPSMLPDLELKHIPFSQLPKIIRATPESTGREEIIEWVEYYGSEEEKLHYLEASPKKRKEIVEWIKYHMLNKGAGGDY